MIKLQPSASLTTASVTPNDDISLSKSQIRSRPWLPMGVLADSKLSHVLESVVRSWAENWFSVVEPGITVKYQGRSEDTLAHSLGMGWSSGQTHDLCLTLSTMGRRQIGSGMLALDILKYRLTQPDAEIISRLTGPVIEDLIFRLASFLQIASLPHKLPAAAFVDQLQQGFEQFKIAFGEPAGTIIIYLHRDVAYRARRNLSSPVRNQPELISNQKALNKLYINVGAYVGASQLELADFSGLAIGDILVLDRRLDEVLQVTINQKRCLNVTCDVQHHDGHAKLQLTNI